MVTFTLNAPATVGTLGNQQTISALRITSFWITSTPALAPIDTGEMEITLTEPSNGWQETLTYQDSSVPTFMSQVPAAGASVTDALHLAIFAKLVADRRLPAGELNITA